MNLIVAVDKNWAIGYENKLLTRISADLRRFKKLTTGHTVILGRKTLGTFPGGRPLPNRENIIMSSNKNYTQEGTTVCHSIGETVELAPADAFVIGGASIYSALLPYCDKAYVTQIAAEYPADCFLPNLGKHPEWETEETGDWQEENGVKFRYVTYRRR